MSTTYITSEDHVPEDTDGEVTIQVTDQETKEIFQTRARLSRQADELDDPDMLTIMRGPHENTEEQWYIEVIETEPSTRPIDEAVLRKCIRESQSKSNVVTVRSEEVRALATYLVEVGEYDSVSEVVRTVFLNHLSETQSDLLDQYVSQRMDLKHEQMSQRLVGDDE
ncbi:hypothetical protein [Halobacterium noricense]|uniref:hypothetical protein n=1 Tax=Halobacterium noricense TaxID=223182 RepID=UPI001E3CB418|nr:hypothetical protein [Halobacterium noricense]UHH23989.1 hypothetical protein LT974_08255 [Halobacterium noricense]